MVSGGAMVGRNTMERQDNDLAAEVDAALKAAEVAMAFEHDEQDERLRDGEAVPVVAEVEVGAELSAEMQTAVLTAASLAVPHAE
jgi:hypothetical protein